MESYIKISLFSFVLILLPPLSIISDLFAEASEATCKPSQPIQQTPDLIYEYRLAELGLSSPVELDYNDEVRGYIELYTGQRKAEFERIIGLAEYYFPVFDAYLDRYNLPLELKYLTIVESGLNPLATSRSGAAGLWQFLFNTAEMFDLEVTSYVDERRDLYLSTEAACKYLAYLYHTFQDWHLVLSSYNGGPGEVRKAVERNQGETDYWKIRPSLSEQARNYVPAFIAATYVMNYYREHQMVPVPPAYDFNNLDTLHLGYAVSFDQISALIGLSLNEIRSLNPMYRRDYISKSGSRSVLVLPVDKVGTYLRNENQIIGFTIDPVNYHIMLQNGKDTRGKEKLVHEVQPGEYPHKIAFQYGCTIENIKAWNSLEDYVLHPGQKLVIWVDPEDKRN